MRVYVREESEATVATYLDVTEVVQADPTWPASGAVGSRLVAIPGRPYSLLAVSQTVADGDAALPVREEAESGPAPLPAWNVTDLAVTWAAHGTGYDAFLSNHELLVLIPAA